MAYRFSGSKEDFKKRLAFLTTEEGLWFELNPNQIQFRHKSGGILNWYPSTGTVMFQGPDKAREELTAAVLPHLTAPPEAAPEKAAPALAAKAEEQKRTGAVPAAEAKAKAPVTLGQGYDSSELVIGLVGAVGTEMKKVVDVLAQRLKVFKYDVKEVHISSDVIPQVVDPKLPSETDECYRISRLMDAGNEARKAFKNNAILAIGAAAYIAMGRTKTEQGPQPSPRQAYIINSLKHPSEVARLREVYPQGFYLLGVHSEERRRHKYLVEEKRIDADKANELILRDQDEHVAYGQRVTDTFHMSDFFVRLDSDNDKLKQSVWRILDILFAQPYATPTFDEYAMFLAFAASLRSADLSRQVGAVVTQADEVLSTGANDCPKYGGGLYWPKQDPEDKVIKDKKDGRDYMRGEDANSAEQEKIIDEILSQASVAGDDREKLKSALEKSRIRDLTEFGRVVHAEMESLLCCARNHISTRGAALFCTTFPCHNCAKHIVAAGIHRVVYIEPYPKSKALEFHTDSISLGFSSDGKSEATKDTVLFEPFVGVGPRRFFDLFSMRLGSGFPLIRKDQSGQVLDWRPEDAKMRVQMLPVSYLDLELLASTEFGEATKQKKELSDG